MINAGRLTERVRLLEFAEEQPGVFLWREAAGLWAAAERRGERNVYAQTGRAAPKVEFLIRRQSISLHNALLWRGRHCFLTNIQPEGRLHLRLTAALVQTAPCLYLQKIQAPDENNVLRQRRQARLEFQACVAELYTGYQAERPDTRQSQRLALTTPKAIALETGRTVETLGRQWRIAACHTLADYQNEYEIISERNP